MFILSKEDHIIQVPTNNPNEKVSVEHGVSLLGPQDLLMLLPGSNEVPNDKWQFARQHLGRKLGKSIKEYVVKVESEEEGGKPTVRPRRADEFDAEDFIELVEACVHLPTLDKWRKTEAREDVRLAIMNRMDALEKGKAKAKSAAKHPHDDDEDDD